MVPYLIAATAVIELLNADGAYAPPESAITFSAYVNVPTPGVSTIVVANDPVCKYPLATELAYCDVDVYNTVLPRVIVKWQLYTV